MDDKKQKKEYIEREALMKDITRVYCTGCNSYNGVRCRACGTGDALDMVEDAPTADVAPRSEVAREIFEKIEKLMFGYMVLPHNTLAINYDEYTELKKKYTGATDTKGGAE